MEPQVTDIPFKLSARTIAILKDLPVLQCDQCTEYVIEDPIMERVDALLEKVDQAAVLEIVQFAAGGEKL
jgi:YgiT-type zinc finger domain-containing protein